MINRENQGFALATVLIASVVLLAVLVSAITTTIAVRSTLDDQQYTRLAELAAEAGNAYAKACMAKNNNQVTWSNSTPLKPNTDCNGAVVSGLSAYVYEETDKRSYFVVQEPTGNNISAKGYIEALRSSTGSAWRIWSTDVASAASNNDNLPIGTSIEGYWTTAPAGYLLEDGSAVSRTTYADLFAVIGTTFGAGNGSTTFNVPDSRGRVQVNKSTDTEFNTLGETGGEKVHTLTIDEMPSHSHKPSSTSNRFVTVSNSISTISTIAGANPAGSDYDFLAITYNTGNGTANNSTQAVGGGGSHNNLQPYITIMRAIKY